MRAWCVTRPGPIAERPVRWVELPDPEPGPDEIQVSVSVCGVCRTDLHVAEGDPGRNRPRPHPGPAARALALDLGAASAGPADGAPPEPLDAAILFAPAGELVPVALAALDRGGTLAIAGIHVTDIPRLNYQEHLFQERQVRSVTANTRADGEAFLGEAAEAGIEVHTSPYPLDAGDRALADLPADRVNGAAVLVV